MEGLMSCDRLLEYKSLRRRILAAEKPSLNFGSAIHLALEYRYKTYQHRSVDDAYYNEVATHLTQFFDEHQVPSEDWRNLNWCMKLLRKYNEKYDIEQFNLLKDHEDKPMVELSFALPLYTYHGPYRGVTMNIPIIYTGRIDLPVSIDGSIFITDHKTTSMMGQMFWDQQRRSSQQKGYVWAFQNLTGIKVDGYQINGIRTKEPPQYVQAGVKGTGKYTTENWWNETFQRERFIIKPGDTEEWKANTIALLENFFHKYNQNYLPMMTTWCSHYGRCAYYDVCQLDASDRDFFLASGLYADNTWSPLKSITQSMQ